MERTAGEGRAACYPRVCMADTATTVAIIGAAATVVAAMVRRVFSRRKKDQRFVVKGSSSAGATSGSGGTSVATSSSGGNNITVVGSPGAVVVPPHRHPGSATRDPSDRRVFVREESLEEVLKVLSAVPPLERSALAQRAYVGRWARWTGEVASVSHVTAGLGDSVGRILGGRIEKPPMYRVLVRPASGFDLFSVKLPESERATVEILREGDIVEVEGILDRIDDSGAALGLGRIISYRKKPSDLK